MNTQAEDAKPPESGAECSDLRSSRLPVRAAQVLHARNIWIAPLLLATVFVAVMATMYLGSVVNPTGHLHDLPVMIVDQDTGAVVQGQHINVGADVTSALEHSSSVTSHLKLTSGTLNSARNEMDHGRTYATVVIPATLTRSALLAAGVQTPGSPPPPTAAVDLEANTRLGTLGVNLASGVVTPAIAQISPQIGSKLSPFSTSAARSNPALADRLAKPVSLTTSSYRQLPDHSALGLSAFYVALLALMAGFVAACFGRHRTRLQLVAAGAAVQSASTGGDQPARDLPRQVGPRCRRGAARHGDRPARRRRVTRHVRAERAAALALLTLAALMIATGTLALLAAFGSIGQLLAMILLVYLSLASSGGTVPSQALPGIFRTVGSIEPLRNTLSGSRAILYFGAQGDAGLTHAVVFIWSRTTGWPLNEFADRPITSVGPCPSGLDRWITFT